MNPFELPQLDIDRDEIEGLPEGAWKHGGAKCSDLSYARLRNGRYVYAVGSYGIVPSFDFLTRYLIAEALKAQGTYSLSMLTEKNGAKYVWAIIQRMGNYMDVDHDAEGAPISDPSPYEPILESLRQQCQALAERIMLKPRTTMIEVAISGACILTNRLHFDLATRMMLADAVKYEELEDYKKEFEEGHEIPRDLHIQTRSMMLGLIRMLEVTKIEGQGDLPPGVLTREMMIACGDFERASNMARIRLELAGLDSP